MSDRKNAVGYVRVSTEEQAADDKFGVQAQVKAIMKYADKNGYKITCWKQDEMSGTSDNRPAMNEILYGDCQSPQYEAVIAYKSDRIARDTKLYFYYLYILEKKGIKLISTQEDFGDDNEFANIYRSLLLFVAEQERKNIQLRTAGGRSIKAKKGGYAGGTPPFGYKAVGGKLEINDEESKIVKIVFDRKMKGFSMLSTSDFLNEHGYRTRKGTQFHAVSIQSILKNQLFYQGFYKYGDMEEYVEGEHKPILPRRM